MSEKKRQPIEIQCSRCSGTGAVPLAYTYAATLDAIRSHGAKGVNVEWLAKECDCRYTAMCNRVTKLESFGLVAIDRTSARHMIVSAKE